MARPIGNLIKRVREWARSFFRSDAWLREQAAHWAALSFPEDQRPVAATVAEVLVTQIGVGFEALTPATHFIEDLGMDDLEPVQVVLALEEEFGFSIPDTDCEPLATVQDLVHYVHQRVTAGKPASLR